LPGPHLTQHPALIEHAVGRAADRGALRRRRLGERIDDLGEMSPQRRCAPSATLWTRQPPTGAMKISTVSSGVASQRGVAIAMDDGH
jgi:hypothetical protein